MVKNDRWIIDMGKKGMIEPFEAAQVRKGVISFGVNAYGYDLRIFHDFRIPKVQPGTIIDPKNFDEGNFEHYTGDVCEIPAHSSIICRSLEYFRVEQAVLCRAMRHAAQGILDSDRELIAKAKRAILRPLAGTQARFGGLTIDMQSQKVTRWNRPIHLTPLEFKVIAYLARQAGHPVCLNELLSEVWSASPERGGTLAQVHNSINRLRQKIEPDVRHPRYLLSERCWGYWLQDPTLPQHAAPPATGEPAHALPFETDLPPELIDN